MQPTCAEDKHQKAFIMRDKLSGNNSNEHFPEEWRQHIERKRSIFLRYSTEYSKYLVDFLERKWSTGLLCSQFWLHRSVQPNTMLYRRHFVSLAIHSHWTRDRIWVSNHNRQFKITIDKSVPCFHATSYQNNVYLKWDPVHIISFHIFLKLSVTSSQLHRTEIQTTSACPYFFCVAFFVSSFTWYDFLTLSLSLACLFAIKLFLVCKFLRIADAFAVA